MAHASTHPAHPLPPVAPRRLLLAQRLLRGEGSVEVTAFRAGETLTTAVHGVSAEGRLVVAHVPNLLGSLGAFHTPAPLDVRVDVLRDALDLTVPTRLASVHLLGTLRWCRDSAEVAELGLRGRVADLVADVGPRVRVGVVETQRILLHDVDGVAVFCRHTLPLTSRGLVDQAELADLADDVLGTAPEVLADLADAGAVAVLDLALEEPAHRLQTGVRVRRDVHAAGGGDVVRAVEVQEAPRADQTAGALGQRALHRHGAGPAQGHLARLQDLDDGARVPGGLRDAGAQPVREAGLAQGLLLPGGGGPGAVLADLFLRVALGVAHGGGLRQSSRRRTGWWERIEIRLVRFITIAAHWTAAYWASVSAAAVEACT